MRASAALCGTPTAPAQARATVKWAQELVRTPTEELAVAGDLSRVDAGRIQWIVADLLAQVTAVRVAGHDLPPARARLLAAELCAAADLAELED